MTPAELTASAKAELIHILGSENVLDSHFARAAYAHDASFYALMPKAVAQAQTLTQIQGLFQWSQKHSIPLCFRAAGTSLSGQAVSSGVLVDISKYWREFEILNAGECVRAQPGVIGGHLNRALRPWKRKIGPDPASIQACMIGGILANNASGMCCGVEQNAYHTLKGLKAVLPDGYIFDSLDPNCGPRLKQERAELWQGLSELRQSLLENESLCQTIRRKYRQKNTTGYALNALLDFEHPEEILTHLLIGSEGTLAFIAEAELYTVPDAQLKWTGLLFFENIELACQAVAGLQQSGAAAIELMDSASLQALPPEILSQWIDPLPSQCACLLLEYHAEDEAELQTYQEAFHEILTQLNVLDPPKMTTRLQEQVAIWKVRKGLYPSVGAVRQKGSSVIIEDIVFPLSCFAQGIVELQALFQQHAYEDAIIFGHAKEGNIHFVITQSFQSESEIQRYQDFMHDLVALVLRHDGALKAEHGTGRNMAPFVEAEWGGEALALMQKLKQLFDPQNCLNPGVILNTDPLAHIKDLKTMPIVDEQIDACTECGFCEAVCPSRRFTLTPRQRIVIERERARLKLQGEGTETLQRFEQVYHFEVVESCAADSLCALSCPVGIDTGQFVKSQRAQQISETEQAQMASLAARFKQLEIGMKVALSAGKIGQKILGNWALDGLLRQADKLLPFNIPRWHAQYPPPNLKSLPSANAKEAQYLYFPSCLTRNLAYPGRPDLPHTLVRLAKRAQTEIYVPPQSTGMCCGLPFTSKGYVQAGEALRARTIETLMQQADGRAVIVDTSPCTHYLQQADSSLKLIDSVAFLSDIAPRLPLVPRHARVVLHPVCSLRHMGLEDSLVELAKRCAQEVIVPDSSGCCAYAGDRGLMIPGLPATALADTRKEIDALSAPTTEGKTFYCSSSRSCEMGLSMSLERDYISIVYLLANSLVWQR